MSFGTARRILVVASAMALLLVAAPATASSPSPFVVSRRRQSSVKPVVHSRRVDVRGGSSEKSSIDIPMKYAIGAGMLLAFNSGFANGCCLSGAIVAGTKQAVAAVTGAWTTSAVSWAQGKTAAFQTQATMILSYMFGSAIAGVLNPKPTPFKLSGSVGPAFLLCAALTYQASQMATSNGEGLSIFALMAIANGIQNSITSVHTGNLVRSAHYSGMTSDMGTFVGQMLGGNKANAFRFKVCLGLALAFWTGGAVSVFVSQEYKTASLMFNAVLYALCGLGVLVLRLQG